MIDMLARNLKIYFRDKSAVFFSLFGALLIIGLYALFLSDTMTDTIELDKGGKFIMNSWVMGGLIAAATATTGMGAYGVMVNDKENKNYKDFYASPVKKSKIVASYLLDAICVSTIMTLITFVLAELYIVANDGDWLSFSQSLKVIGVILLTVLSSCAIVCFICSFLNSSQAFSGCSILVGSSIGFLTGSYVPIGSLPKGVQNILSILPCTHAAALLRQLMTETPIKDGLAGSPKEYITGFKEEMGIVLKIGDYTCTATTHILFIVGSAIIFYILSIAFISHKKNR